MSQNDIDELLVLYNHNKKKIIPILAIFFVILLATTSTYTVDPDEEAIIIRFGKYVGTNQSGLHFKLPFGVDKVLKIKTKRILQEEFGFRTSNTNTRRTTYSNRSFDSESLMLTGDLNVADVEWVVQYQISDPFKFVYQTSEPIQTVRDISESIMRRVVGDRLVTEVLTTGRTEISSNAKLLTQKVLDKYDMGVKIVTVKLQDVNPPEVVKKSFNEVNEAKQEQERVINQAEEEYNKIIPEARGKAEKIISEAKGFVKAVIDRAIGDAKSFKAMHAEYKKAPKITRDRIYLETMQGIYEKMHNLTVIDSKVKGVLPVYSETNNILKKGGL